MAVGDGGCEAYTAMQWGVLLSHEIRNVAEAETVSNVEGNMCGPAMRGSDALPGSKNTSRCKGMRRNLGGLVADRRAACSTGPRQEGEEPKLAMHGCEKSDRCVVPWKFANKAERSAAERMEGRHLVEGRPAGRTRSGHRTGPACHAYRLGPAASLHRSPQPRTAQRYHPRQEPGAGKPHAGICAGGWEDSPYRDQESRPCCAAPQKPRFWAFEFVGFSWILSSETSLFKGLRATPGQIYFFGGPFPPERVAKAGRRRFEGRSH